MENFEKLKISSSDQEELIRIDGPSKCLWSKSKENPHSTKPFISERLKIAPNILYASGMTPMVKLNKIPQSFGLKCDIYAKCEFFNPGSSCKSRIGFRMIEEAENKGDLKPGYTVVEASSGNTATGLAIACAVKGYKCIIVMGRSNAGSKLNLLKALGAEIVITSDTDFPHPESQFVVAQKLQKQIPNSIYINQYQNPGNSLSHYDGTGPEILYQMDGELDMIVASVGTGGTITGIGRKVKETLPNCLMIGVDPVGSNLARPKHLNDSETVYEVRGIGHEFEPTMLDYSVVDEWIKVKDVDSYSMARRLIKEEGILCGETSGTTLFAAILAAKRLQTGQKCVVIFSDGVHNYLNKHVDDRWLEVKNFKTLENPHQLWWWEKTVSNLSLENPLSITGDTSCQEVILLMRKLKAEQFFVFDSSDELMGVITMKFLLNKLANAEINVSDKLSKLKFDKVEKVDLNTSLGMVSRILERESIVVVTDSLQGDKFKRNDVIGIVTEGHLVTFIALF